MKKTLIAIILCTTAAIHSAAALQVTPALVTANMSQFEKFVEEEITPNIQLLFPGDNAGWFAKTKATAAKTAGGLMYSAEDMLGAENLATYCTESNKNARRLARIALAEDPVGIKRINELLARLEALADGEKPACIKHDFTVKWLQEENQLPADEKPTLASMPMALKKVSQEAENKVFTGQLFAHFCTTKKDALLFPVE